MSVYVVSDIHGLKDRYDFMLKELNLSEEDSLYILGDVIDRGKDGIAILQDIMKHKNMHMIIGNHEYMMLKYYRNLESNSCDLYDKLVADDLWNQNHNQYTKLAFEKLSHKKQQEILSFIEALPVAYTHINVNGEIYYLVHGCPHDDLEKEIIYRENCLGRLTVESYVWNRIGFSPNYFDDRCVIVGHTPTLFFQNQQPYEVWFNGEDIMKSNVINIDCGCAANNKYTRLGVIRLDDRKVFYF